MSANDMQHRADKAGRQINNTGDYKFYRQA